MSTVKSSRMETLYKRLADAGFPRRFVRERALPSWWDDSLAETETGFAHGALLVARHIGADVRTLLETEESVTLEPMGRVLFKSGGNAVPEVLRATTSVCVRAARIILRGVAQASPAILPTSAAELREALRAQGHRVVTLDTLLKWCWSVGIPVLHLKHLPGKKPQALCLRVKGRPVIFLCDAHDLSAWQAFHLAHELGHILLCHLEEDDSLWLDEKISRTDTADCEREANAFAVELLLESPNATFGASANMTAEQLSDAARRFGAAHSMDAQAIVLNVFHYDPTRVGRNMNAAKALEPTPAAIARIALTAKASLNLQELSEDDVEYLSHLAGWESAEP
jgi:Zn-dependent peptidase ImmA (M78 family)